MVARNEHTGDKIQTKETSEAYRDNFDAIFRKAAEFNIEKEIAKQNKAYLDMVEQQCCGRCSPCSGHDKEEESSKPISDS